MATPLVTLLINIVLIIAVAGGVFSLIDQFHKFLAKQTERNAKKRELKAAFEEFMKTRPKSQSKPSR